MNKVSKVVGVILMVMGVLTFWPSSNVLWSLSDIAMKMSLYTISMAIVNVEAFVVRNDISLGFVLFMLGIILEVVRFSKNCDRKKENGMSVGTKTLGILSIPFMVVGMVFLFDVMAHAHYVGGSSSNFDDIIMGLLFICGPTLIGHTMFACVPADIASRKGRSYWGWYTFGWFFPPIAFIASLIIEDKGDYKVCPYCAEHVKIAAKVCRYCGKELNEEGKIATVQQ